MLAKKCVSRKIEITYIIFVHNEILADDACHLANGIWISFLSHLLH